VSKRGDVVGRRKSNLSETKARNVVFTPGQGTVELKARYDTRRKDRKKRGDETVVREKYGTYEPNYGERCLNDGRS